MRMLIRKIKNQILDLLYPPKCIFCGKIIDSSELCICGKCSQGLHYESDPVLTQKPDGVDMCISPLVYTDEVRDSLIRYKFNGYLHYALTYSQIISKILYDYSPECDIITWVPLSRKRLRSRGYDQARLIAEQLSGLTGIRCRRLLRKNIDIQPQSGTRNASERAANVKGVYSPLKNGIKGSNILLVDDIITTGSTVSECAKTLKTAGALSVTVVTVASA